MPNITVLHIFASLVDISNMPGLVVKPLKPAPALAPPGKEADPHGEEAEAPEAEAPASDPHGEEAEAEMKQKQKQKRLD